MISLRMAAVVVSLIVTAVAQPLAGAAEPPRAELAGTTILTGSQTAVIPVKLSKAATLIDPDLGANDSVLASGRSPLVGFALVSDQEQPDRVLVGGRLPWRVSDSLPSATVVIPLNGYPFFGPYEIPAGDYRLYLLTDNQPARVQLTFGGLTGTTALKPNTPVPYTLAVLDETLVETPGTKNYATMGASAPVVSDGLLFNSRLARYDQYVGERVEACVYQRKTIDDDFGPGCTPDGAGAAFVTADLTSGAAGGARLDWGGVPGLTPGEWGYGFNQESVGVLTSLELMIFWLSFNPVPLATEPSPTRAPAVAPQGTAPAPARAPLSASPATAALPATGGQEQLSLLGLIALLTGVAARQVI